MTACAWERNGNALDLEVFATLVTAEKTEKKVEYMVKTNK